MIFSIVKCNWQNKGPWTSYCYSEARSCSFTVLNAVLVGSCKTRKRLDREQRWNCHYSIVKFHVCSCLEYCTLLCSLQIKQGIRKLRKFRDRWWGCYKGLELFLYEEQLNRLCLEPGEGVTEQHTKPEQWTPWRQEQFVTISGSTEVKENQMKPAGYRF